MFTVHALASGSSGNATLVRAGEVSILIDAGIGMRKLTLALAKQGLTPGDLSGAIITHEHSDHVQSAHALSKRHGVPLIASERTLTAFYRRKTQSPHLILPVGDRWRVGELEIETFPVPHDAADPVGINIVHIPSGHKVSHLTDLGHVTDTIPPGHPRRATCLFWKPTTTFTACAAATIPATSRRVSLPTPVTCPTRPPPTCSANMPSIMARTRSGWRISPKKIIPPSSLLATLKPPSPSKTNCPVVFDVAKRDSPSALWTPGSRALQLPLF